MGVCPVSFLKTRLKFLMVENPHFIAICVTSSSEFFRQLAGELYAVFVDERGEIHVEIPVEERGQVAVIVAET